MVNRGFPINIHLGVYTITNQHTTQVINRRERRQTWINIERRVGAAFRHRIAIGHTCRIQLQIRGPWSTWTLASWVRQAVIEALQLAALALSSADQRFRQTKAAPAAYLCQSSFGCGGSTIGITTLLPGTQLTTKRPLRGKGFGHLSVSV